MIFGDPLNRTARARWKHLARAASFALCSILGALACLPHTAMAFRPSFGVGLGWSLPLDDRVSDVYGGAPFLLAGIGVPLGAHWEAEISASGLRSKSDLSAPSFLDQAEGTLLLVPIRAGLSWSPRSTGPWLRASGVGQWSREEVSYELLGEKETLEHSRFDPGAAIAGGWIFRPGGYALRAGLEAAWIAGDRQVLRSEGDAPKTEDASAGSHVALSFEVRF